MRLAAGTTLGPYEILAPIGAGGMGEVYKGRDTRLNRIVAIKVLPQQLSNDPELKQRFEREAQAIASLNHPHICTLYDVGEQDGISYLVMEFVDGEALSQRLEKGPLPLSQTFAFAAQIADALSKAHRVGITHRDVKPGNIMLTKSGAKLLDFGLAKLRQDSQPPSSVSSLPTNANLTGQGMLVGTLQYMAPEQLDGQDADSRTDIFAFGAVLYEMVTGRKAFEAKTQASLIASILTQEPPAVATIQTTTPPQLDHVIRRCLAKAPDERWQAASDLQQELQWIAQNVSPSGTGIAVTPTGSAKAGRRIPLGIAVAIILFAALAAAAAVWSLRPNAPEHDRAVARLAIVLPSGDQMFNVENPELALSRDGRRLVYAGAHAGSSALYLRNIDALESKMVSGTEGAINPFFSPDGEWIGFFSQGKMRKVSISGGGVQTLADAPIPHGADWGADDVIYFAPTNVSGLWKVSVSGGSPAQEITHLDRNNGEVSHRYPQVLPGGKAILFTVWNGPGRDEKHVSMQILATSERRVVVQGGDTGRYVPTGHIVYARADSLAAVPFDIEKLSTGGAAAAPLAENVREGTEGAQYAVSDSGLLVYVAGAAHRFDRRLVWVDRSGNVEPVPAPQREYASGIALSPDGLHAAVQVGGSAQTIWIYDFVRATLSPFVTEGSNQSPVWSPDSKHIAYAATRKGFRNVFWRAVDGTGDEERLTTGENLQIPRSFSPDGKWLAFRENSPATGNDLFVLPLDGDRTAKAFLNTQANELAPAFSPDGKWLAYHSNESGRQEVYVRPFPGPGPKTAVSTGGGANALWSRNGKELFYLDGDKTMAVDIATSPKLSVGLPRLLYKGDFLPATAGTTYDISNDGRRFLRIQATNPEPATAQINVVMNWFEELRQLGRSRK